MWPFTIAHITDLHLRHYLPGWPAGRDRRGRDMPQMLPEALAVAREAGADLVALTGDILDIPEVALEADQQGQASAAAAVLETAQRDYRLVRDALDAAGMPYIALAGNHDHAPTLERAFGARPRWRDVGGYRIVGFDDAEDGEHVPHRAGSQRQLFEAVLAEESGLVQIHLQHFVLFPDLEEGWPFNYADAEGLRQQIGRSGNVRLCLSGHYHAGTDLLVDSGCCYATAPAMSVFPHPMVLYRIAGRRITRELLPLRDSGSSTTQLLDSPH